jgi:hypothetical protein
VVGLRGKVILIWSGKGWSNEPFRVNRSLGPKTVRNVPFLSLTPIKSLKLL